MGLGTGNWMIDGVLLFCVACYFIPTILAVLYKHPKRLWIALVNLAVGWTGIGIIFLIIYCFYEETSPHQRRIAMPILPQFIAKPLVGSAQWFFKAFGFDLVDYRPQHPIKDAQFYRPMFSPWMTPEWSSRLRAGDSHSVLSLQSRYNLYTLALESIRRCNGDLAECGVYKGGTAKILAQAVPDRPLYLFDTFMGMPETDAARDLHKAGDFSDVTLEGVSAYLSEHPNAKCFAGLIPESLAPITDKKFAFVHIDLDIYAAIKSACEFFYPRMQPGGSMLFDDYGFPSCPGARLAIDEFFSDKPEVIVATPTGQAIARKL